MDPVFCAVVRASLALLFASACVHKARDLPRFAAILADYEIAPRALARPAAFVVPTAEAITAISFLLGAPLAPVLGLALIAAYSAAIGLNLLRGRRDIDCGCGGPGSHRIGPGLLVRNALLAVAALSLLVPQTGRPLGPVDLATIVAAVAFLALAWSAGGRLASLSESSREASLERIPT